jgi:hypothetical protein
MHYNKEQLNRIIAFARYLSWADLLFNLYESEVSKEPDENDSHSKHDHEWKWPRTYLSGG